jgi:hypothetical protein
MFAGLAVTVAHGSAGLDPTERRTLLAMREEEKLAHDLYIALAAASDLGVFTRIAGSEARHEQAVERALTAYAVGDPTDGYAVGRFPSSRFQQLYDRLVARGAISTPAALSVGIEIERLDIADLSAAIRQTDEALLDRVYANLRTASQNHLAAFQAALSGESPNKQSVGRRAVESGRPALR